MVGLPAVVGLGLVGWEVAGWGLADWEVVDWGLVDWEVGLEGSEVGLGLEVGC